MTFAISIDRVTAVIHYYMYNIHKQRLNELHLFTSRNFFYQWLIFIFVLLTFITLQTDVSKTLKTTPTKTNYFIHVNIYLVLCLFMYLIFICIWFSFLKIFNWNKECMKTLHLNNFWYVFSLNLKSFEKLIN